MALLAEQLRETLAHVVGPAGFLAGSDIGERYCVDWIGNRCMPLAVIRPDSPMAVSEVMRILHRLGQRVVPQGGMTGLVAAGLPQQGEVVLSLERLNRIEGIDPLTATATVQAGAVLQTVQQVAEPHGLYFPVDLGARGSATIGGMISTNAGGNRVLRYGMTRQSILGLEVVLPDGTMVSRLRGLMKDNAGYDLKHLFIGSEGTLGVVTRAILQLQPKPTSMDTALVGLDRFEDVLELLRASRNALGPSLTSFEVMWDNYFSLVTTDLALARSPLERRHAFYVLIETSSFGLQAGRDALESILAKHLEAEPAAEAVVAQSLKDAQDWWRIRDSVGEAARSAAPFAGFDISLPLGRMQAWVADIEEAFRARGVRTLQLYGHLGDGNLHIVVGCDARNPTSKDEVYDLVHRSVAERGGSISAEHGIGVAKKAHLAFDRSPAEIELMKKMKRLLDPGNLLSPGRIIDTGENA